MLVISLNIYTNSSTGMIESQRVLRLGFTSSHRRSCLLSGFDPTAPPTPPQPSSSPPCDARKKARSTNNYFAILLSLPSSHQANE